MGEKELVPLAIMNDATRSKVRDLFQKELTDSLEILLFRSDSEGPEGEYTAATLEILTELAALSDGKLGYREVAVAEEKDLAKQHEINMTPALVFLDADGRDQGFRFYGAPVGYEFMALLEDIVDVSRRQPRLSEAARGQVAAIDQPLLIQVFSTPT